VYHPSRLPTAETVGLSVDSRSADTNASDATSLAVTIIVSNVRGTDRTLLRTGRLPPLEFEWKFPRNPSVLSRRSLYRTFSVLVLLVMRGLLYRHAHSLVWLAQN